MSQASVPIHSPAPEPGGPIACTMHPNEYAGRLEDFRQGVFAHLVGMELPEPTRLRLLLAGDADPEAVRELLVREQGCCAFFRFTLTVDAGGTALEVRAPELAADMITDLFGSAA